MDLGTRIKNLREEAGMTQLAFARILNINNSTLCQYENGDRIPSDDIKIRIADYFEVSLDYLLGRTDQRKKPPAEGEGQDDMDRQLNAYMKEMTRDQKRMLLAQMQVMSEQNK